MIYVNEKYTVRTKEKNILLNCVNYIDITSSLYREENTHIGKIHVKK